MRKLGQELAIFFLKCILKKIKQKKQNCFLFKPVLIFFTFKDIKKQAAELSNITGLLPLLFLLLLVLVPFLAPFIFLNIHLKGCSVQSCLFVQCWSGIFLVQCRENLCNVGSAVAATNYYRKINRSKIKVAEK